MKKLIKSFILFFVLLFFFKNGILAQTSCINFEEEKDYLSSWKDNGQVGGKSIFIENPPQKINKCILLKDGSGASIYYNDVDFKGNWNTKYSGQCLCFDYKIDYDSQVQPERNYAPQIKIYSGNNPQSGENWPVNLTFATFVSNKKLNIDNEWFNFCLPTKLCQNGKMPSNEFGRWVINNSDSCQIWNNLIQNVTGMIIPCDYNGSPSEKIYFDNFCSTACGNDSPPITFDPCCPPMNAEMMKTLFKIVPTGTITDSYKIIFTPTAQFKASSQAYCDYIKTLYPSINRLTYEWNLYDAGTLNAPAGGSRLEQYYNWFEPQGNGDIKSQTNLFTNQLVINKWYKIAVGIFTEPETKAFDGFKCSASTNFSFRIQVQNGMRKAQISDGKNIVGEMNIDPNNKKK